MLVFILPLSPFSPHYFNTELSLAIGAQFAVLTYSDKQRFWVTLHQQS